PRRRRRTGREQIAENPCATICSGGVNRWLSCRQDTTGGNRPANTHPPSARVGKTIAAAGDGNAGRDPAARHAGSANRPPVLIESPAMDLIRHLRFFVTVAEEGHFGRAAAALDMTQPPLSQGLRKLDQHLGSELVHRTTQGAVLTPAGAELLPRARLPFVDGADRVLAEAGRVARARRLLPWGATRVLPARVVAPRGTVLSGRGEATVATRAPRTVDLVDAARSGMCDLAVVAHPGLTEG